MTVLILDDELATVELCERVLRKSFNFIGVTTGEEALGVAKSNEISVALVDQRMPKMTGLEFLVEFKKMQPQARRVVMTAYTDLEEIVALINDGQIHGFVLKPWDNHQLHFTVKREAEIFAHLETIAALNAKLSREHSDMLAILREIDPDFAVPESATDLKEVKNRLKAKAALQVERLFVDKLLKRTAGNVAQAAREGKINRTFLHRLLGKNPSGKKAEKGE